MSEFSVCLTGGIASGKTYISDLMGQLGAFVIDTDVLARQVVAPGTPGLNRLVDAFGQQIILPNGQLDRSQLKQLVFNDQDKLAELNGILHPLIWEAGQALAATNSTSGFELWVVPLFNGKSQYINFSRVLVVDVLQAVQYQRIVDRDHIDMDLAKRIVSAQLSREARLKLATDVITNNGTKSALQADVERLFQIYWTIHRQ